MSHPVETEKSLPIALSREERVRQKAIQTLDELSKKQSQASLLLLKLQQYFLTWSIITVTSFVVLVYFGSSLFCLSPLLKDSYFCRDKGSNNSDLIGLIAASISVIGVIQSANKIVFIRRLNCDLRQSKTIYNSLLDTVYADIKEKEADDALTSSIPQAVSSAISPGGEYKISRYPFNDDLNDLEINEL